MRFKQENHPYTLQAFGTPKNITAFTRKNIIDWRNKYYKPSNMILVIAGNFSKKSVIKSVENTFGKEKSGKKIEEPKFSSGDYSSFNIFQHKIKQPQTRFYIDHPSFGLKEKNRKQLITQNILRAIVNERLCEKLRENEQLLYRISLSNTMFKWLGATSIRGSVSKEKLIKALQSIKDVVDIVQNKGVSKKEVSLYKNFISKNNMMRFDFPNSINKYLATQLIDDLEILFPEDFASTAKQITVNDINKLAKSLFNNKKVNISLMGNHSKTEVEKIKTLFRDNQ